MRQRVLAQQVHGGNLRRGPGPVRDDHGFVRGEHGHRERVGAVAIHPDHEVAGGITEPALLQRIHLVRDQRQRVIGIDFAMFAAEEAMVVDVDFLGGH